MTHTGLGSTANPRPRVLDVPSPRAASAAQRALSRYHFAFLRGVLSGIEPAHLWSRYMTLEGRYDPRLAERTLREWRDELSAVARCDTRHRIARLVVMDVSRVPTTRILGTQRIKAARNARRLLAIVAIAETGASRYARRPRRHETRTRPFFELAQSITLWRSKPGTPHKQLEPRTPGAPATRSLNDRSCPLTSDASELFHCSRSTTRSRIAPST